MADRDWQSERRQRSLKATGQQRRASDPLRSVWVEASAGTGKTKVLSDRVLRLLLNGVAPSKILCLTYTKAAAVEMSSRIAKKLSEWAVAADDVLDNELVILFGQLPEKQQDYARLIATARQLFAVLLDTPGGMKIQTMHSFCQEILKRFPLEAKVSPYFEVIDDRAKNEILATLKQKILLGSETTEITPLAQAVGYLTAHISEFLFSDMMTSITDNTGKIIDLMRRYPCQEDLLQELAARLGVSTDLNEEILKNQFLQQTDKQVLRLMAEAWLQGSSGDVQKANVLQPLLQREFETSDYDVLHDLFLTQQGNVCAKYATQKVLKIYPALTDEALKTAHLLLETDNKMAGLRVYQSTKAILILAEALIGEYQHYKFENAKMDYDDLIVLTRRLLEDKSVADWVLFKLDGGIDHILIDEAQDTSPQQWAIVRSLTQEFFAGDSRARTVFVVGDRKQSIYSFQGADPREFEKMRQYFKNKSAAFDEVNLDISFRSTAAVLDSVNTVFHDEVARQGVLSEEQEMMHIPFRCGEGGQVEIWPLVEAEKDENPDIWLPPVERKTAVSTGSRLAKMIAVKIKNAVGRDMLVSQGRPLRYGDFMILVQRRNAFVDELVRECKQIGVAIAGIDKIKLREQVAVQDLVALGHFLLLPTDDLTLAVVLKSPLFGLDDDDLFKLCYGRGQASVWTRLGDMPAYVEVYKKLQTLLNMADYVRPFELYSYVLDVMQGRKKFRERMGDEVDDGLDEFVNLTLSFEQEHIPTLQTFVQWIEQDEVEVKRELEQNHQDAVRIMTVHGSKGLQAPIVILPDMVRQVNVKKGMGMLWDDVFYYPLSSADYEANCLALKETERQDQDEEYRRLLYVALTRAEDRLYLCGYSQKKAPQENCWYHLCSRNLEKICQVDDGKLVYRMSQQIPPKFKYSPHLSSQTLTIPQWLFTSPQQEMPLAKPYTPSKPDEVDEEDALFSPLMQEDGNGRYRRGSVIHKLLQFLPGTQTKDKMPVIREFLRQNAPDFTSQQTDKIAREVDALISNPQFAPIFGESSKAEVPIMGEVDGKIISGQIDRLVVLEKEIWIVDFKTNRPAAHSPADVQTVYVKQMAAYKSLLERVYPQKTVKTFILWTDTTQMMPINT